MRHTVGTRGSVFTALNVVKDSMRGGFDEMILLGGYARYGLLHRMNGLDYIDGRRKIQTTHAITANFYSLLLRMPLPT